MRPFPWLVAVLLFAGCAIDRSGLATMAEGGGPPDGAAFDAPSSSDGAIPTDTGPGLDGGVSDAWAPILDAGVPYLPTEVVDLPVSGDNQAHPAVAWTGSEFAVAFLVSSGAGATVELLRLPPGVVRDGPTTTLTTGLLPRQDLSLAVRGPRLAVGWIEDGGGGFQSRVRVLPDDDSSRLGGAVLTAPDHDDAHVVWDGGALVGISRRATPVTESLQSILFGAPGTPGADDRTIVLGLSLGELGARETSAGWLLFSGSLGRIWRRRDDAWSQLIQLSGLSAPVEGDVGELSDGALLAVWSDVLPSTSRELVAVRLRPASLLYSQLAAPSQLGWVGADPAVASAGDRVVVAWSHGGSTRPMALGMVAADASALAGPCDIPNARPVANDPDIACGAGWCLVVWSEASTYDGDDYITRILQLPDDPALFCP